MNIKIDQNLLKYSYESLINYQKTVYGILEYSNGSLLEAKIGDKQLIQFKDWLFERFKKMAETIRNWVSAIITFLTKTMPTAIGKFVNKVLILLKLKKSEKKVDVSKLPPEEKAQVEDAAKKVNVTVAKKAAEEQVKTSQDIPELEKICANDISTIKDEEAQKTLYDALKNKNFVTTSDNNTVQCPDIRDKMATTLNTISELCMENVDCLQDLLKTLDKVEKADVIAGADVDFKKENPELMNSIKAKYSQSKYVRVKKKEMYSIKHLNKIEPTEMKIADVEKALIAFSNDKNAVIISKSAKELSEAILKALDKIKSKANVINPEAVVKMCNEISEIQSILLTYVTDATNDYAKYIQYAINLYGNISLT